MRSPFELRHKLIQKARYLRKESTQSEKVLWERVRDRRLGGFKFRRQHVLLDFIVDFCCPQCMLIVEVHGHVHSAEDVNSRDIQRATELAAHGYSVLFVSNADVLTRTTEVCDEILDVCKQRRLQSRRSLP